MNLTTLSLIYKNEKMEHSNLNSILIILNF